MVAESFESAMVGGNELIVGTASLGGTVVVDLCDAAEFESICRSLEEGLSRREVTGIVVDCRNAVSLGCSTLGMLVKLCKKTRLHGASFSVCGLSPLERETLRILNLHRLWTICSSRAEAIRALRAKGGGRKPAPSNRAKDLRICKSAAS